MYFVFNLIPFGKWMCFTPSLVYCRSAGVSYRVDILTRQAIRRFKRITGVFTKPLLSLGVDATASETPRASPAQKSWNGINRRLDSSLVLCLASYDFPLDRFK